LFPPEKMIGFHFGLPGHFGRPTLQMTSTFKKRVTIAPDAHPPLPMDLHAIGPSGLSSFFWFDSGFFKPPFAAIPQRIIFLAADKGAS